MNTQQSIDIIMRDLEREFYRGSIGITDTGEIVPMNDIYIDMSRGNPATDYYIAPLREIDREMQRLCPRCQTSYRTNEIKDGRCPFCWVLI